MPSAPDAPFALTQATSALADGDPTTALALVGEGTSPRAHRLAGRALLALGDRAGARRRLAAGLDGALAEGDARTIAALHDGLAAVARALGELDVATTHHDAALAIAPPETEPRTTAQRHRDAGIVALRRGRLEDARRHTARAVAFPAPAAVHAADRARLGHIASEAGDHREAIDQLERAAAAFEAALGPAHVEVADARLGLAAALLAAGRATDADAALRTVLASREDALGRHHPDLAPLLLDLEEVAGVRGDVAAARAYAARAAALLQDAVLPDHPLLRRARARAGGPP